MVEVFLATILQHSAVERGQPERIRKAGGAFMSKSSPPSLVSRGALPVGLGASRWAMQFLFVAMLCSCSSLPSSSSLHKQAIDTSIQPRGSPANCRHGQFSSACRELSDYCWSESHFVDIDLVRTERATLMNGDLLLYTTRGEEGGVYCAYPVDGGRLRLLFKRHALPFVEFLRVTP